MSKNTLLFAAHSDLDAKMIDFNGWNMPVQYKTGILKEHMAVREGVGVFDTAHMGEFALVSKDVRKTLNQMLVGDFSKVKVGRMRYSFICNEDGGIKDDVVVFIISDTEAMICVNAGDIDGDFETLLKSLPEGAALDDQSDNTGKIDIQGPLAYKVVEKLTGFDFRSMPFYSFIFTEWQGSAMILSRSGYTGSAGVEIFVDADALGQIWYYACEAGKEFGITPCGLGARDTLRLEAGLPLYGHELSAAVNPLMTGYTKLVSLDKKEDFPGKDALIAYNASGKSKQKLVGISLDSKRVAREGSEIYSANRKIGTVTSGGPGVFVGGSIAMGYVEAEFDSQNAPIEIQLGKKRLPAKIVELPFFKTQELRNVL